MYFRHTLLPCAVINRTSISYVKLLFLVLLLLSQRDMAGTGGMNVPDNITHWVIMICKPDNQVKIAVMVV